MWIALYEKLGFETFVEEIKILASEAYEGRFSGIKLDLYENRVLEKVFKSI